MGKGGLQAGQLRSGRLLLQAALLQQVLLLGLAPARRGRAVPLFGQLGVLQAPRLLLLLLLLLLQRPVRFLRQRGLAPLELQQLLLLLLLLVLLLGLVLLQRLLVLLVALRVGRQHRDVRQQRRAQVQVAGQAAL